MKHLACWGWVQGGGREGQIVGLFFFFLQVTGRLLFLMDCVRSFLTDVSPIEVLMLLGGLEGILEHGVRFRVTMASTINLSGMMPDFEEWRRL